MYFILTVLEVDILYKLLIHITPGDYFVEEHSLFQT